ncbi:MAG: hypothetical protein HY721_18285 [Planctomycetes bacterium]|nr:hypothetical protein [Planctomycetota bacterium]
MKVRLACVVEGDGDEKAVPVLLRRLADALDPGLALEIPRPVRMRRSQLLKEGQLERAAVFALQTAVGKAGLLVLMDADDDPPSELGPRLASRIRDRLGTVPACVVLARRDLDASASTPEETRSPAQLPVTRGLASGGPSES